MKKVFLIATNHLRDQRWILLTMFGYAILMSVVMGIVSRRPSSEDARFFLEQQLWFAALFSVFLSTAAVNTDMRTRRIAAILSKAVQRWQYLLGIVVGISMAVMSYCLVVAVLGHFLSIRSGSPLNGVTPLAFGVVLASVAVACVGLFFGLLLPPLFATTATLAFLTAVPLMTIAFGKWIILLSPVAFLLNQTIQQFHGSHVQTQSALLLTGMQAVVFFFLSLQIFLRRDLTRPTE